MNRKIFFFNYSFPSVDLSVQFLFLLFCQQINVNLEAQYFCGISVFLLCQSDSRGNFRDCVKANFTSMSAFLK